MSIAVASERVRVVVGAGGFLFVAVAIVALQLSPRLPPWLYALWGGAFALGLAADRGVKRAAQRRRLSGWMVVAGFTQVIAGAATAFAAIGPLLQAGGGLVAAFGLATLLLVASAGGVR